MRGVGQRWGSSNVKRRLWNHEFSSGRWKSLDTTPGDIIYHYVEKYCRNGSILDLGCGSGNTGCELDARKYTRYTGVDISDVALEKARSRSEACQRGLLNQYYQSDVSTYVPNQTYDVILFRESLYYIPLPRTASTLQRYARFLKEWGVFIVRWHTANIPENLLESIQTHFVIVERSLHTPQGPLILVFRSAP